MRIACKCVLVMLVAVMPSYSQVKAATGGARGVVVDQNGKPVVGATVFLAGAIGRAPRTLTDTQGRFLLKGFSGDWGLIAFKEEDGYPNNFPAFFQNPGEQFPYIQVDPGAVTKDVTIRLGRRAAILKFDLSDDGGKLLGASAFFTRPDLPDIGEYRTEIRPNEKMLVPAVPLRLTVKADGYEVWHYGGEDWETDRGLMVPVSGESLTVFIRLKAVQ